MVLLNFANLAVMQGMMDETRVFYLKMVRLARRWQLVKFEMEAKGYLGILLYRHMQQRKAGRDYLHQAIRLARQLDNPLMESHWSYHVANLLTEVGKHWRSLSSWLSPRQACSTSVSAAHDGHRARAALPA